jgi:hypothetical protein
MVQGGQLSRPGLPAQEMRLMRCHAQAPYRVSPLERARRLCFQRCSTDPLGPSCNCRREVPSAQCIGSRALPPRIAWQSDPVQQYSTDQHGRQSPTLRVYFWRTCHVPLQASVWRLVRVKTARLLSTITNNPGRRRPHLLFQAETGFLCRRYPA